MPTELLASGSARAVAAAPPVPLAACLARSFRDEPLGADFKCEACGAAGTTELSTRIGRLPAVLILVVGRSQWSGRGMTKIRDRVQVDVGLVDVGAAATAEARAAVPTSEYEVQAIVEHHGRSSTCGHYTALGRDGSAWRDLNDHRVKTLSPRDARPGASEGFLFVLVRKGSTSAEASAREAFRALFVVRDEAEAAGATGRKRARMS